MASIITEPPRKVYAGPVGSSRSTLSFYVPHSPHAASSCTPTSYLGVTAPVSYAWPEAFETAATEELDKILRDNGQYESPEESRRRCVASCLEVDFYIMGTQTLSSHYVPCRVLCDGLWVTVSAHVCAHTQFQSPRPALL